MSAAPDPIAEHRRLVAELTRFELHIERLRRALERHEAQMRAAAGSRWEVSVNVCDTQAGATPPTV